jgi:hypothetical protein
LGSLILLLAALMISPAHAAIDGSAQVKKVVGTVAYTDDKGGGPLKDGDTIHQGATITTGANSYVDLDLGPNGNALRVEADTTLAVNKLSYAKAGVLIVNTDLEVKKGAVVANVINKLSRASKYEIKTPGGVAGIRGTVLQASTTQVLCLVGTVEFRPTAGGGVQLVIGGTVYSAVSGTVQSATTVQTSGLAKSATGLTQNAAPASVSAVVQQFTAAIAAQAATTIAKAGGDAATAASTTAKDIAAQLVQQVQAAANQLPEGPAKQAALAQVATLTSSVDAIQTTAAATAAAAATVSTGGTAQQAQDAAQKAAQQTTVNQTVAQEATTKVDNVVKTLASNPQGAPVTPTAIIENVKAPDSTQTAATGGTTAPTTTTGNTTVPNSTTLQQIAVQNSGK